MAKESRRDLVFLKDILHSINKIQQYSSHVDEKDFLNNEEKQDSIIRRLEIIGESVKNLSENCKKQYPDISWRKVAGLRDILIHQYFSVSMKMVWKVVTSDLLELKQTVEKMIDDHQ